MEKQIREQEQLTVGANSHRLKADMEAQDEIAKDNSEKKPTSNASPSEPEAVVRARKAWEESNEKRKRGSGRKTISEDELKEQEKFIKKGIKPPEDSLPPEKVQEMLLAPNNALQAEVLIEELKKYKKTGAVTPAYFAKLEAIIGLLLTQHKIPQDEGERILDEARQIVIEQMGVIAGGADESDRSSRNRERPPRASDTPEEDAARVATNTRNSLARQEKWFADNPSAVKMAEDLASQKASMSSLPGVLSEEDKIKLYEDAARNEVYREFHKGEAPNISDRDFRASTLEPDYLKAQKAILGEVDSRGRLTGKGKDTMEQIKASLTRDEDPQKSGYIIKFLDILARLEERDWTEEIDDIMKEANDGIFRQKLEKLMNVAEDARATRIMHERGFNPPNSIQEIALDIVATDIVDYRTGGKYEMFKRVRDEHGQERMKFQQNNFIQWARAKMLKWEEDNPDDPQDMFKLVGIFGTTRGVGLSEMLLVPSMFKDRDTGEILEDLKLDLIYQAWPWGYIRDSNITYRSTSGSDEDLGPKALGPIFAKNVLTKPDVLNRMVNMSDVMTEFDPDEKNSKTGQALRMALLTYHDLTNPIILEKMMRENGNDLAFFDNKKFLEKYVSGQMFRNNNGEYLGTIKSFGDRYSSILFRQRNNESLSAEELRFLEEVQAYDKKDPRVVVKKHIDEFFTLSKPTSYLFDSDGKLKKGKDGKERMEDYLDAANVFRLALPSDPVIKEVRERIRLSVMEKMGIDYDSARWVEAWAYKLAPFTGIAARNDTTSTAFDSYSKTLNTGYYAQHQSHSRRGGAYGNKFNMYQFKRLGMDFFSISTEFQPGVMGPSILEYIQGGQGNEVDFRKQANVMVFGENTTAHFYSDHVSRTFNQFHELIESKALKLHEIVNTDPYGRVHYDSQKFNELVRDTFLKNIRYPYATWANLDFTEEIAMFEEEVDLNGLPKGHFKYKSRPIARHMFGKAIFNKGDRFDYSVMLDYEKLPEEIRLKAKRYFQLEKRLKTLQRNIEAESGNPKDLEKLSPEERQNVLKKRIAYDTQNALTEEEADFLLKEQQWYYEGQGMDKIRSILVRMDRAFVGDGRQHFWKEAAKVRLAAELKEARRRFGNVQTMMSFEEVEKFLSGIAQLDADIYGNEGDFAASTPKNKVFTKGDIDFIRKMSGTGTFHMLREELQVQGFYGGIAGIWKALGFLFSNMVK